MAQPLHLRIIGAHERGNHQLHVELVHECLLDRPGFDSAEFKRGVRIDSMRIECSRNARLFGRHQIELRQLMTFACLDQQISPLVKLVHDIEYPFFSFFRRQAA